MFDTRYNSPAPLPSKKRKKKTFRLGAEHSSSLNKLTLPVASPTFAIETPAQLRRKKGTPTVNQSSLRQGPRGEITRQCGPRIPRTESRGGNRSPLSNCTPGKAKRPEIAGVAYTPRRTTSDMVEAAHTSQQHSLERGQITAAVLFSFLYEHVCRSFLFFLPFTNDDV